MTPEQKRIIDEYVSSGRADGHYWADWEGQNIIEQMQNAEAAMRDALIAEVRARTRTVRTPRIPGARKLVELTRSRVEPMVRGLFPRVEQDQVLALLEKSVVFVSPKNVDQLIRDESFGHSAWTVANLFLLYTGAELLDKDVRIVGFSEATTCFVSPVYLSGRGPFEDFIVHEAAHVFHNWKRAYAGLPHTRRKEWLLEIEFRSATGSSAAIAMEGHPSRSTHCSNTPPRVRSRNDHSFAIPKPVFQRCGTRRGYVGCRRLEAIMPPIARAARRNRPA